MSRVFFSGGGSGGGGIAIADAIINSQFMTLDGSPSGVQDMRVAGTLLNPIDFFVEARPVGEGDRYIKTCFFLIADSSANLSQFGNLPALTNGCQFIYSTSEGEIQIEPQLKSNYDFLRLSGGTPAYGTGVSSFRSPDVIGSSEGYFFKVDFQELYGIQLGLLLRAGSGHRLIVRIRDNTTGVDAFTARIAGFRRAT